MYEPIRSYHLWRFVNVGRFHLRNHGVFVASLHHEQTVLSNPLLFQSPLPGLFRENWLSKNNQKNTAAIATRPHQYTRDHSFWEKTCFCWKCSRVLGYLLADHILPFVNSVGCAFSSAKGLWPRNEFQILQQHRLELGRTTWIATSGSLDINGYHWCKL